MGRGQKVSPGAGRGRGRGLRDQFEAGVSPPSPESRARAGKFCLRRAGKYSLGRLSQVRETSLLGTRLVFGIWRGVGETAAPFSGSWRRGLKMFSQGQGSL